MVRLPVAGVCPTVSGAAVTAPQNPRVTVTQADMKAAAIANDYDDWPAFWLANGAYAQKQARYFARHREAAEAASKAREAALVEALGAIVPFAEDMTESGRQAIANAHRILAALTKEPDA